ncbi:DUF6682 family protein [Gayadomonas joobiniege]|uniref:phage adaptor protein n=1 Tax=Gayadomonas joobiniege TaxID=1234606 RepID=UPI00037D068C|nr:DUF6682 family protein [Gayadomonas joobiniege]
MATIKVVDVIERAREISQDKTNISWSNDEWLMWFNDAVLAVVNARPDSLINNGEISTVAGSKQSIPDDGIRFIDLVQNIDSGTPIRAISRRQLDDQVPAWHKKSGTEVHHFVFNPVDPKNFYIYPQPQVGHKLEIMYSIAPTSVEISDYEADTTVLPVDDVYLNPILDLMLYRAYSKDADYVENQQRAIAHQQAAYNALNIKSQSDGGVNNANS